MEQVAGAASRTARRVRRRVGLPAVTLALTGALVLAILYSITIGRYDITVADVARILWENIAPVADRDWTEAQESVVELVRLPRILAAVMVGAGLAISGAALQGMFRNPLVDPGIVGVTEGAGFGGTLAILIGLTGEWRMLVAFCFGIGSVAVVKALASNRGRTSILTLVLAGVVISAFFAAAISVVKLVADPQQKLPAITYWLMGSLASTAYSDLVLLAAAIVPASVVIYLLRFRINVISLGEEKARALGVRVELVQWAILAASAVVAAGIVSTSGIIGWVGLVIPHIARTLVGADHGRLLPVSALLGAIYMLLVDNLARTATTSEIPIGIITALIGVPVFVLILRRIQANGGWRGA